MEKRYKIELDKSIEERLSDTLNIQVNFDDTHFAVGCSDGQVRLYTLSSCHPVITLNCRMTTETPAVTSVRWRPSRYSTKNVLISTTGDGFVSHWHATSGKLMDKFQLIETQVLCSDITQSGSTFALGCSDNSIRLFDENSRSNLINFEPGRGNRVGHSNRVFSVKWLSEELIASGGWDNNVIVWDKRSGRAVGGVFGPLIAGESLEFCDDLIYTGSYDYKDQIQIWDLRNFSLANQVSLSDSKVYSLQFDQKKKGFLVGCTGEVPIMYFGKNLVERCRVEGGSGVFATDFCKAKEKFVAVNTEHLVGVYDILEESSNE